MKNQLFDFSVNVLQALLWRHNNAVNLQALLEAKQAWYDENYTAFWNDWYTNVFDLRTANDFGCTVWAVILGVPLSVVQNPEYSDKLVFGFDPYQANFNRSNFGSVQQVILPLTTSQKRLVLQLRYLQLITRGCIPQINAFLKRLFGDQGPAYVIDHLDMTITYRFEFDVPSSLQFILTFYDILPRPAGVKVNIVTGP